MTTAITTTQSASDYKPMPHEREQWAGYTLDELRYQRAVCTARLEIQKERLMAQVERIRTGEGSGPTSIAGRLLGSLNYVDYGILAFRLIKRVSSMVRSLRRRH